MSQVTTNPVQDFGQMYLNASSNQTSPTTDVIGAAISVNTIDKVTENISEIAQNYNFFMARA